MEFESGSHHESHEVFTGTKDETETRRDTATDFLKRYLIERGSGKDSRVEYDGVTELHFSGGSLENYAKLRKGTAILYRIEGLYEDGKLRMLHIIVSPDESGYGGNTDVYIEGRALEDYLAAESGLDENAPLPPEKK
jgi:hypothetical protein